MRNSNVKLLGDSVYSLETQDTTEQQFAGLGKLSYGINTEPIVEHQRGGLGKISYQGANPLAKMSMYGDDDALTFSSNSQLMPSMNFARTAPRGGRRSMARKPAPGRSQPRQAAARPRQAAARPVRQRATSSPPINRIYPPDTTKYRQSRGSAMLAPQNRGVVKTSQIETGKPRTKARTGQVATSPIQVQKASAGMPVKTKPKPRRLLPIGWMNNIVKIFES